MGKLKDQAEVTKSDFETLIIPVVPDETVTDLWNKLTLQLVETYLLIHSQQLGNRIISQRRAVSAVSPTDPIGGTIEDDRLSEAPDDWVLGVAPVAPGLLVDLWICYYDVDKESDTVSYSKPFQWPPVTKLVAGTGITLTEDNGEITISLT